MRSSALALLSSLAFVTGSALAASVTPHDCAAPGRWVVADQTAPVPPMGWSALAGQDVVLLGEQHDSAAHHRWQLATLTALHALRPTLVIGLEMLPREAQPALDDWVAGKLSESAFLRRSGWYRYWGLDADLYLPILHFARERALPLVALNVTPERRDRLVEAFLGRASGEDPASGVEGEFGAIPAPRQPGQRYRERLATSFHEHAPDDIGDAALDEFIAAQLIWDVAMADALARRLGETQGNGQTRRPLAVAIMGRGHVEYGDGVAHQLQTLGIPQVATLLPVAAEEACRADPTLATALFVVAPEPGEKTATPKLGVAVETTAEGLKVTHVAAGSPAQQAGLRVDDILTRVAERALTQPAELAALMARVLPGSRLPLVILRDGQRQALEAALPLGEALESD